MVCVSGVADVCILSDRGLKVNRFLEKDVEVFQKAGRPIPPGSVSGLLEFAIDV